MKPSTLTATLGLGLVLFGSLSIPEASGQRDLVQLRVSVFNSSPILPSTLERAEGQTGTVLRDVGVEVIWLNCPQNAFREASFGRCAEASFPSHLHLSILRVSRGLKASSVGISFSAEDGKGCYADLFYEPIQQLQEETQVSPSVILGHAMAHELGHLLLGTNSHSPSGLMRAHWTRQDLREASKGNLRFSSEQSLSIRSRLAPQESQGMPIIEVVAPTASIEGPKAHAEQSRPATLPAELPFRLLSGYLIEVEGRIGTQNKLRFILDTGTTRTIIDQGIAGKLELDGRKAQSFNFDRKLNWESTSVPELQVGPVHATNIPVFVGRLAEYSEFAKNADAIIGMDVLRFSDFSIDYGTKKIVFHSGQRDYTPPADEPLSECVILELLVQGHPVRVVVDTGFPGLLLYEERIRSKVPALRTTGRPTAVSIGGRLQAKQVMLPDVVFGARNDEVSVLLVKAPSPDTLPGIDGVVGLTPLKAHRVHLDLVGKGLSWE